jgi:Mannosyl-glycoprotein endo-beta-N-acetylglucosaminidase
VANHKGPQSGARKIAADDLDLPPQTRERTPKRMPTYQVAREAPIAPAADPHAQQSRVQSPRVLPPEPTNVSNATPAKGRVGADPARYSGVMSESIARQQTGRLGLPQPPSPARPVVPPAATPKSAALPASRATAQVANIFEKSMEREAQAAASAGTARPAQQPRRRSAAPVDDMFEVPELPVVGSFQGLVAGVAICSALIWLLFFTPLRAQFGLSDGPAGLSNWMRELSAPVLIPPAREPRMQPLSAPPGETSLVGAPSLTIEEIDAILASYGSPATGSGRDFYNLGIDYGIDPAYAVAFFIHESSAGTASGWAGIKPDGSTTHNVGNIICAGYSTCFNRFRDYGSWSEGIEDWYELIAVEYIEGRGTYTVEQIIPIYAPSFENNVPGYIQSVNSLVQGWRAGNLP